MGSFVAVLARVGVDPELWNAADIVALLEQDGRDHAIGWEMRPSNAAGYLAWRLSRLDLRGAPERVVIAERDAAERSRTTSILSDRSGKSSTSSHRQFLLANWRDAS